MNIVNIVKNPRLYLASFFRRMAPYISNDELYLRIMYYLRLGKVLHLSNPVSFNEKLQWLKLYDRNPLYTILVDKYAVKKYVANIIGEEHIIKTIATYDSVEDIDWNALPKQFVLKCTHDSGGIVVCKDKTKLDFSVSTKKLAECLRTSYYPYNREWPYKDVPRRIIAEQYMEDTKTAELRDYKFFCFNGEPKALFIASDRMSRDEETKFDFFDMDFNHLPFRNGHPNATVLPDKPLCFEEMKQLAAKLSVGFPQVRVDFYEVDGKVYFGEMTFFHWSGMTPFEPEEWDYKLGKFIEIKKCQRR